MNNPLLRRIGIVFSLAAAAVLGSASAVAAPPQKAVDVLGSVRPAVGAELPGHAKADSGVTGVLNPRAIEASVVSLTLADGRKAAAQLQRVAKDDLKRTQSWVGSFSDEPGSLLVLTKVSGTVSGYATYGSETFEMRPAKGGRHLLYQVDPARLPAQEPEGDRLHVAGEAYSTSTSYSAGENTLAGGTAVVHDLLVVYTPTSAAAWSRTTLEGMIQSAVQSANQAYLNSQVGISLNVVGLQQVSMTEKGGAIATLDALEQNAEVQSLRDKLAADMIVLVSEDADWCGYASVWISWNSSGTDTDANAVVSSKCLSNHTLAHEVGHMQRLEHDRASAGGSLAMYAYSYGYKVCTSGGFKDIMSYPCSPDVPRIVQFSSPRLYYNGYPTGISYESNPSQAADAARSLNDNAATVAAYRVGSSSVGTAPTAPANPTGLAASSVAYNGVSLIWLDNATNESGFKVERSTDGVAFSEIASLGADVRSFADAAVSVSANYFYRVRAFNSVGFSGYSNTVNVTTPAAPPPPPPAPSGVAALNRADGSALVSWVSDTTSASGYEVRRESWDARKMVWGRSTIAATVPGSVRSIIDSTNNGTFRYFVRAVNSGGTSAEAGPAQVTVSGGAKGGRNR